MSRISEMKGDDFCEVGRQIGEEIWKPGSEKFDVIYYFSDGSGLYLNSF